MCLPVRQAEITLLLFLPYEAEGKVIPGERNPWATPSPRCHPAVRGGPCRTGPTTLVGVLTSVVLLAVIGGDLGPQRAAQPVNPVLDLRSRVAILMHEHRTQIGEQAEHDAHGPGEGHPLGGEAVMEELRQRLKDRLALGEVCWAIVGQALRREQREGRGAPPRSGIVEFIPLSFWYDAPLASQDCDRRHDPWLVYGLPRYSPARWSWP